MRFNSLALACCVLAGLAVPAVASAQSMSKNPKSNAMAPMTDSQHMAMPSHDSAMKKTPATKATPSMKKTTSATPMKKKSAMGSPAMDKSAMKADTAGMMKKPLP
jgi:hypothetical protein